MVQEQFTRLVREAEDLWIASRYDYEVIEPKLLEILNLVKTHPRHRPRFAALFAALVPKVGLRRTPGAMVVAAPVLEFCMRELQWPQIRAATEERIQVEPDPSIRVRFLRPILSAYEPVWINSCVYRYYSRTRDHRVQAERTESHGDD